MLFDDDGTPLNSFQPDPQMLEGARWLGQTAEFLLITANGPHMMADEIEAAAGIPLLDMVDLTLAETWMGSSSVVRRSRCSWARRQRRLT